MKHLIATFGIAALFLVALALRPSRILAANESVGQWIGIAPANWSYYVSTAAENSVAIKASQATLNFACYTNQTTTALTLMTFNSTTVPADGAVTPMNCGPVAAGTASMVGAGCATPPAPTNFAAGLSVAVSTGASCYTKTSPGSPSGMFSVQYK